METCFAFFLETRKSPLAEEIYETYRYARRNCAGTGGLLLPRRGAQQPKKVPRIGYLSPFDPARDSARAEGIRLALRERGHIEGQNIATEYRYMEGKLDRAPELAAELVRLKVDLIVVAGGDPWVRAARVQPRRFPSL